MGIFSSSRRFDPTSDLPSLAGKVAVVSGANQGIGYFTALHLALKGAKVYLGVRSERKGLDAIAQMENDHPVLRGVNRLHCFHLDLSTVSGAKKDALAFLDLESRLDILVNNAGVADSSYTLGKEGVEEAFATNVLGPFVLTTTLLPLLQRTASAPGSDVRVVTVASGAHNMYKGAPTFDSIDDFNSTCVENPKKANSFFSRATRYGMTKLADILFAKELQRRLSEEGTEIISLALHPGTVASQGSYNMFSYVKWLVSLFFLPPEQGAFASLFGAASPVVRENAEYRGAYLDPFGVLGVASSVAQDPVRAKQLWLTCEKVTSDILSRV